MATELIATGNTLANSADITLASGAYESLFLKDAAGPDTSSEAFALIQIKDSSGQYFTVGKLTKCMVGAQVAGPATYRVQRPGGPPTFGVEKGT
ncbi:MAG: hypothetical protein H7255_14600 [Ramlibacter sp.]|nr:hypothetical protein [Ramlibacter sp.]